MWGNIVFMNLYIFYFMIFYNYDFVGIRIKYKKNFNNDKFFIEELGWCFCDY